MVETYRPILVTPGVQPSTDFTTSTTNHFVAADKIRFRDGFPEKIGGWVAVTIDDANTLAGCGRSIFSYNLSNSVRYIIGTHANLYYLIGSQLTNISPLVTSTTAIANSLASHYATLANNPVTTTLASATITIADTATKLRVGDAVTLSGSSAVNGVPAAEINTSHFVRTQATNSYTISVTTAATSAGTGGGASVVQRSGIITVTQASHGFPNGERIKIASSGDLAGILAAAINKQFIIRNKTANTYDIVAATAATSSVSAGGGAGTTVQGQIADGLCDATAAQGYGAGLYGAGLYGTALVSTTGALPVRSWTADRFGNNIILTPGNQTGVYTWDSVTAIAPVALTNAPTAVNYVYTSNEIVVTLGDSNVGNRRKWSDQGVSTTWSGASTNQAGEDDIEGASTFISHLNVKGINLEFTDSQVYTSRYIGRPFIWETKLLDDKSGIISKNARMQHNGTGYWMGTDNFYYYRSGNVEIIPSNSSFETTFKKYVFDNINISQKSKIFCWFNRKFNEVWWHYPSSNSSECDRVVRLNVKEMTWTTDTHDRSAGEYPTQLRAFPYLAQIDQTTDITTLYEHENTNDDNGAALTWSLTTPFFDGGVDVVNILGVIPDSIQTGNISCVVNVKQYPQSSSLYSTTTLTITPTSEIQAIRNTSRFIQYVLSGSAVGQAWRAGNWQQAITIAGGR
ncbi:hypothetical protein UFOVP1454_55 [uncultured Caudovirales phage]|uniref:Uncharacterized protein n=1 Tax=uncultured Caudovirales phage TaxID=2100421 RepID=A0A6J5SJ31_9CAUD|nr:hypothetical protein UFOVP1454_55 [uncultured Caudovirales phage]